MRITPYLMALGYILLLLGLGSYIYYALMEPEQRSGSWVLVSFLCCMSSLLFFNLPAVFNRRKDEKAARNGDGPQ